MSNHFRQFLLMAEWEGELVRGARLSSLRGRLRTRPHVCGNFFFFFFEKEDFFLRFRKKRTTHDQVHRPIEKWPLERACITGLVTLGRKRHSNKFPRRYARPFDSLVSPIRICWIVIYPANSAIQRLND